MGGFVGDILDPGGAILGDAARDIADPMGLLGGGSAETAREAQEAAAYAAMSTEEKAAEDARKTQLEMFYQSREDQLPWLQTGAGALSDLNVFAQEGPGSFEESPYYQLGLDKTNRQADAALASRGLYSSGKAQKIAQDNALANMATNRTNFVNEWLSTKVNPTQSLAGTGQTTAQAMGQNALATGQGIAGNIMESGANRASGYVDLGNVQSANIINQADARTAGLQTVGNVFGTYMGSRPTTATTAPTGTTQDLSQYYDYTY